MAKIAILGSGMMGSAISMPLADIGHDVHLVGTHLDREIIDSIQATGYHPTLEVDMPEAIESRQLVELLGGRPETAVKGASAKGASA